MNQELFIHIGMPKTGTTGLQFFMHKNRQALREQGVYYPVTMREPAPTATQHRFVNEYMRRRERDGPETVKEFPHPIRRISHEIKTQGVAKNVISEELFSFDPSYAAKFLAGFKENFACKVVVFLRRQDTWAESMYAQSIRGGYRESFDRFLNARHTRERMDFQEFLGVWAEHFGAENIIVVPYADKKTRSPEAMIQMLGADMAKLNDAEQRNKSLSGEAISFMHGMRSMRETGYPKFNRIFGDHLADSTRKGGTVLFTPEHRAAFMSEYAESNDEVARVYLKRDPAVEPLFDVNPENFPPAEKLMVPVTPERQLEILNAILTLHGKPVDAAVLAGKSVEDQLDAVMDIIEEECRTSTLAV